MSEKEGFTSYSEIIKKRNRLIAEKWIIEQELKKSRSEHEKDKIFFENLTGYAFILMFASIMFAVNPLIIIVPVAVYYTVKAWRVIRFGILLSEAEKIAGRLKFIVW